MAENDGDPRQKLMAHILEAYPKASESEFSADDGLLEKGIVDSLRMVVLVGFIEREFQIFITGYDLTPDNFTSVNTIAAFLERKLSD